MSERTNCGRCGGDRFLTSWEDKVRCPECGNADPDDVPAPAAYAPRAEEPEAPSGGEAKIEPAEVLLGRILEAIDEVELAHYGDRDIADSIHALRELVERIPPLCRRLTADLARAAEERDYNAQQIEQAALLTESQSGIIADYDDRLKVVQAQLATARAEELEYTVQESFVIQHEDGGDIIGIPVIEGITAQEAQAQGMKWINERIRPVRYRLVHRTVVTTDKMV